MGRGNWQTVNGKESEAGVSRLRLMASASQGVQSSEGRSIAQGRQLIAVNAQFMGKARALARAEIPGAVVKRGKRALFFLVQGS